MRNNAGKQFRIFDLEMSFKDFLIWNSGPVLFLWSGTICAISVEGIMRKIL